MTRQDLRNRVLTKLGESTSAPDYYTAPEVNRALDEAQRLFCLLTLCLETKRIFILTPGQQFYHMLTEWEDWLAPLRVTLSTDTADGSSSKFDDPKEAEFMFGEQAYSGLVAPTVPKLRPATMAELQALDKDWLTATGTPSRYGCVGFDLLFVYKKSITSGRKLLITYARAPLAMTDAVGPEIPEADHTALSDYALCRVRLKEGGQEFAKSATEDFARFWEAAVRRAKQVRARSLAQRYDKLPMELERIDISRMFKNLMKLVRPDLPPERKETPWPTLT